MINWKLRFKNKVTLTAIVLGIIAIAYQVLDLVGIIPPFPQDKLVDIAVAVIEILVLVGVVTDPTTEGIADSTRAMTYAEPYRKER